jgi:hypothetical protein
MGEVSRNPFQRLKVSKNRELLKTRKQIMSQIANFYIFSFQNVGMYFLQSQ